VRRFYDEKQSFIRLFTICVDKYLRILLKGA
jgi:hypothetical protein